MKRKNLLFFRGSRMKNTKSRFLISIVVLLFSLAVQAQQSDNISTTFENRTLEQIFTYLQRNSSYTFTYNSKLLNDYNERITLTVKNEPVLQVLNKALANTPFSYRIINGRNISIYSTVETPRKVTYKITGEVFDEDKTPLPGVTVIIKSHSVGTVTDGNGKFAFDSPVESGTITFSYMGFKTVDLPFKANSPLKVTLKEDIQTLSEVSVIAYGERSKREITGSISSVKGEKLKELPAPSVETLLQGRMSGVEISNISGTPGAGGTQVTIRGFSSLAQPGTGVSSGTPLYVIDGVPVQSSTSGITGTNMLAGLDPSTIESVEVLKDASASSLYGSRASNGVILITTKKGRTGKTEFTVKASQSYSILPATPVQIMGKGERYWHLLMAKKERIGMYDWMTDETSFPDSYKDVFGLGAYDDGSYDYLWNKGTVDRDSELPQILQDSINPFFNNATNWWKYAFQTGRVTDVNLQALGGNENFRYMLGGGLYDETGIMINSKFSRMSFISNMDLNVRPNLNLFARVYVSHTDKSGGADKGALQGLTVNPTATSTLLPGKGSIAESESVKKIKEIKQKNKMQNGRLNMGINYTPIKDLKISSTLGLDYYKAKADVFYPDFLTRNKLSMSQFDFWETLMVQNENTVNYKFDWKRNHNFDLLGGISYIGQTSSSYHGQGEGGPSNSIRYVDKVWPQLKTLEGTVTAMQQYLSNFEEQKMLSFFGRVSYNYRQRYLADFSIRSDGSSVFGEDVRWGVFPSTALAWAFSQEKFMKDYWWLSYAKLRASWGRSGQKFDKAYLAHGLMSTGSTYLGKVGLVPGLIMNNKLTWEKSDQYDIGLDVDLLNYRYSFKLDYYYKKSYSLLMQVPLPGDVYMLDNAMSNTAAISNEGVEFEFKADILRDTPVKWMLNFNLSRNWNRFLESMNDMDLPDKVIGRPIYGIYTYKDDGIVQNESEIPYYYDLSGNKLPLYFENSSYPLRPGMRKIRDLNGDGKISTDDYYYAGSTLPLAYGGITNELTWKDFDLNVLFTYTLRRKIMNMVAHPALGFYKTFGVIMDDYSKHTFWEKEGDITTLPRLEAGSGGYYGQFDGDTDSNIENVSYMRLKQMTLGYTLPQKYTQKIGLESLRLYFTTENLFLITNYSGLDPEIVNPYTGKDEGDMYPLARKFTLGVSLKL